MNVARVEIIAGPTRIAYRYVELPLGDPQAEPDDKAMMLEVYVGAEAAHAPPDCHRTIIEHGYTRFLLGDVGPCEAHGVDDLCWQLGAVTRQTATPAQTVTPEILIAPFQAAATPAPRVERVLCGQHCRVAECRDPCTWTAGHSGIHECDEHTDCPF